MRRVRNQSGFALIELIIVVAIIAILGAIAISNLNAARKNANEAGAIVALRAIAKAEAVFFGQHQRYASLDELKNAGYVEHLILYRDSGTWYGGGFYYRENESPSKDGFLITAIKKSEYSADRAFTLTEEGIVRQLANPGAPADHKVLSRASLGDPVPQLTPRKP